MKTPSTLLLLFLLLSTSLLAQEDFYSLHWAQVYKFEIRDLPKSALKAVDQIYTKAKHDNNIPQFTKALIYQSKFGMTQPDAELHIVQKWKNEIQTSTVPLKNILENVLANLYWQYFRENRWKYYNRSYTNEVVNANDFRTWDSNAMFQEIHQHYQLSLQEPRALQIVSLKILDEILIEAEQSKSYRPTLYDFLAHNALDFYRTNEGGLTRFQNDFELDSPRYFEGIEQIDLPTDSLSPTVNALRIFKALLAFHNADKDPTAYVNLELERIQFLIDHGTLENENELQKTALTRLRSAYQDHPVSAQVAFELATLLHTEGNQYNSMTNAKGQFKKKEALALCEEVIKKFEKSDGAEKCKILKEHILQQTLSLTAEKYVPIETYSRILIEYKNVESLSLTAYRITDVFQDRFYRHMNDSTRMAELARITADTTWQINLRNLSDYQEHSTEIIVPRLSNGTYLLLSRVIDTQSTIDGIFAYTTLQVTNLAIIEGLIDNNMYRYQVVDRITGRPLEGADVYLKTNAEDPYYTSTIDQHLTSDKDGFVELKRAPNYNPRFQAYVTYRNEHAVFGDYLIYQGYNPGNVEEDVTAKAFLFTDRSIYRPGQTVYFKGILIKTKGRKSSVVQGQYVDVYIEDVNGEEVGDLRLKTNAYGSFSGEFKLPASGITGEYVIYVDEDAEDTSRFWDNLDQFEYNEFTVSVEEYKRPTFEVTFESVKEALKVNDSVTVTGNTSSFSGAKIGGAKISYHVRRTVRYPHWYYWSSRNNYSEDEEIAFGEGVTNNDGTFSISFKAIPDENVSKDNLPVFHYEATVDVTDINGETRSATSTINIGYHSLQATLHIPEKVNRKIRENALSLTIENLNGQSVSSKGTIQFYKVMTPIAPHRPRPWSAPDLPVISEGEFSSLFQHDVYDNESDSRSPKKGKLMAEVSFNTTTSKDLKWKVDNTWPLGSYIVELHTEDKEGVPVSDISRFNLFESGDKSIYDNQLFLFETDKASYKVGDVARLKVGSASKDITITIDIDKKHKNTKTYVEHISGNIKEISIPITEDMEGGFAINGSTVNYNAFLQTMKRIPVIAISEKMEIETITFKDKLQPGAKETWSFEIKGNEQPMREAEVLASMYDASLDQFKPHDWRFDPIREDYYYSYNNISGDKSFGIQPFTVRNLDFSYYRTPKQYFDQLDWFGFSITNNHYIKQRYLERLYSTGTTFGEPSKVTMARNKNLIKGFVSGKITSAEDESPLPGVNIVVKGTTRGTVTDEQGNYTIEADRGDELVFSFIGLATTEAKVSSKNTIDVSMSADVTQLSEVVVTAMGVEVTKKSLGYAVSQVLSDSMSSDVGFMSLEGRVAGVQITGMPGGAAKVIIRGNSSLNGGNEPLYVVDGVIVKSTSIDHEDLATVQVLKGQAATSLYGSQAANGVIIITTKTGQKKLDEAMAKVNARKNFNETAFFFPHLSTDIHGRVRFTFTTPESLTRWKLQLLAHTKDLLSATKTLQTITQKELMVTPNAPRFLRAQDEIIFSTKISNLTSREKSGNVALQLSNAVTGESIDALFKNTLRNQPFKIAAKASAEVSWSLKVPSGVDAVQYKVVAKAGSFSDGEQNALPVLSNRILVTETLPMYIRAGETKTFSLEKLKNSKSKTLQHHQLTLEITSNPAWYAVQSLPYLMEFPHECAEQIFSRYYANTLASHIANSNPKVKMVFDQWASSDALISELEKNSDLKSIIIQETPWLRDAQSETEQKKRMALLFDLHTMDNQLKTTITKLQGMQLSNGGFTWFSGGREPSRYITQHIASGFGHLKRLNVRANDEASRIQNRAVAFLDEELRKDYDRLLAQANVIRLNAKTSQDGTRLFNEFMDKQHVHHDQIHYLYMRSFFPDIKFSDQIVPAVEYYKKQSGEYWKNFGLYMKGMIALIHHRQQNRVLPKAILQSLRENSIVSDEMGMYWKENKSSWYWYESPIETQAMLIEAFAEIEGSDTTLSVTGKLKTVDELRIWLLRNKQTSQWKTTKATTEAIYALLLNGTDWLTLENQVEVSVGAKKVELGQQPEAGTGYFKTSWKGEVITPAMSEVKFTKKGQGIAWAGLYWQYFEDIDKITSAETPLKLSKKVFVVSHTDKGELLTEVNPEIPIEIGSLLRVRIELKTNTQMEFLHMKDMRASGLEPVDVLSEYKWQEGLGYYQSIKDASMNFFFDSVYPGVYVFEYDLRVSNKGNFSNGITTIECMYAPEFSSHSEGIRISIK